MRNYTDTAKYMGMNKNPDKTKVFTTKTNITLNYQTPIKLVYVQRVSRTGESENTIELKR